MRRNLFIVLLAWLAAGCVTREPTPTVNAPRPAESFPADAFITQRGTLTVHGRQFTLNGYVARSSTHGLRFVLTENFGGVLERITSATARAGSTPHPDPLPQAGEGEIIEQP